MAILRAKFSLQLAVGSKKLDVRGQTTEDSRQLLVSQHTDFDLKDSNIGKAHRWLARKTILFNIENLVLRARSEFNDFTSKKGFRFQCSGFSINNFEFRNANCEMFVPYALCPMPISPDT